MTKDFECFTFIIEYPSFFQVCPECQSMGVHATNSNSTMDCQFRHGHIQWLLWSGSILFRRVPQDDLNVELKLKFSLMIGMSNPRQNYSAILNTVFALKNNQWVQMVSEAECCFTFTVPNANSTFRSYYCHPGR